MRKKLLLCLLAGIILTESSTVYAGSIPETNSKFETSSIKGAAKVHYDFYIKYQNPVTMYIKKSLEMNIYLDFVEEDGYYTPAQNSFDIDMEAGDAVTVYAEALYNGSWYYLFKDKYGRNCAAEGEYLVSKNKIKYKEQDQMYVKYIQKKSEANRTYFKDPTQTANKDLQKAGMLPVGKAIRIIQSCKIDNKKYDAFYLDGAKYLILHNAVGWKTIKNGYTPGKGKKGTKKVYHPKNYTPKGYDLPMDYEPKGDKDNYVCGYSNDIYRCKIVNGKIEYIDTTGMICHAKYRGYKDKYSGYVYYEYKYDLGDGHILWMSSWDVNLTKYTYNDLERMWRSLNLLN